MVDGLTTFLVAFFQSLNKKIPPPRHTRHNLCLMQYGNDIEGWQDRMGLTVWYAGKWATVFLDDGDFSKTAEALADEVVGVVKEMHAKSVIVVPDGWGGHRTPEHFDTTWSPQK
jgi:hypothetical protein